MSVYPIGAAVFLLSLLLTACAGKHTPAAQAAYQIDARGSGLVLIPPSLSGGVPAKPVPFSEIIPNQYGFNPWEQYVDLSPGMRLAVLHMTVYKVEGARDRVETAESSYAIFAAGHRGIRLRTSTPASEALDKHARHLRLFYQTKYTKTAGQPVRPALVLWSNSMERLGARTAEARQNPAFSCNVPHADCVAFPDKATVSPEVQIVVNQKARYVTLGWTVRDLLRADRVNNDADIRVLRKYGNEMVPVKWEQKAFVMGLPLVAGDELSVGQ